MKLSAARLNAKRGFSMLEVIISATILLIMMGVSFSFLMTQTRVGKEANARAFGSNRSNTSMAVIHRVLRNGALNDGLLAQTSLASDNFGRVTFHPFRKTGKNGGPAGYAYDTSLQKAHKVWIEPLDRKEFLEVVKANGSFFGKTETGSGTLRWSYDTTGDGTPDKVREVLAQNVTKFRVVLTGSYLSILIERKVKTGSKQAGAATGAEEITVVTERQILVNPLNLSTKTTAPLRLADTAATMYADP